MSDNGNLFTGQQHTASVTAYRADGWKVFFSFVLDGNDPVASANTRIAELAANGYTPNAPGMKPGETFEEIAYISRRQKADGTPVLDLYAPSEAVKRKVFTLYIDSDQDAADFKQATGLDWKSIPLYEGEAAISKESPSAGKYIIPVKQAAKVILEPNPAHDPNETDLKKMKPKHKFVRWDGVAPTADAPAPNVTPFPSNGKDNRPAEVHVDENGEVVIDGVPESSMGASFDAVFPKTQPAHWTKDKKFTDAIFDKAHASFTMSKGQVLDALNVKAITMYTGTKDDAFAAIKAFAENRLKEAG